MSRNTDLQPISPEKALQRYLQHRKNEMSKQSLQSHRYRIEPFVRYCEQEEIESMSDLTGRDLQDYRYWRQQDGDLKLVSVKTQMSTIRVFIKWAVSYDAVPEGLIAKVPVPDVSQDGEVNDDKIEADRAFGILEHLERWEYASRKHALFALLWFTGIRMGAARTLDLSDIERDKNGSYIQLTHNPDHGTPLKNGELGERPVAIHDKRYELFTDYINAKRIEQTDEYGREPMFTTTQGRISKGKLRQDMRKVYKLGPIVYSYACPYDSSN